VGALALGYLVVLVGPRTAAVFPAAAMTIVLAFLVVRSGLWRHAMAASRRPA
jgi:hypothetical protein